MRSKRYKYATLKCYDGFTCHPINCGKVEECKLGQSPQAGPEAVSDEFDCCIAITLRAGNGFLINGDVAGGEHWDCPKCHTGTIRYGQKTCGHCGVKFKFEV